MAPWECALSSRASDCLRNSSVLQGALRLRREQGTLHSTYEDLLKSQRISSRKNISEKTQSICLQLPRNPTLVGEGGTGKTAGNGMSPVVIQAQHVSSPNPYLASPLVLPGYIFLFSEKTRAAFPPLEPLWQVAPGSGGQELLASICTGGELASKWVGTSPLVPPLDSPPNGSDGSVDGFSLWQPAMICHQRCLYRGRQEKQMVSQSASP